MTDTKIARSGGLFRDGSGKLSIMRVIALPSAFTGIGGFVASLVAMFMQNPQATAIAGTSGGIIIAALGLKWAQKVAEIKGENR